MSTDYISLIDLYNDIDWTDAEQELDRWKDHAPFMSINKTPTDDFKLKYRCTLLSYALPKEVIVDNLSDWTLEKQQTARWLLQMAGVWNHVTEWLLQHKLIGPAPTDEREQTTFDLERDLSHG